MGRAADAEVGEASHGQVPSTVRWKQFTIAEALVPHQAFPELVPHPCRQVRTVEDEGVAFAVLATGINAGWYSCQQFLVVEPPGKVLIEDIGIDTAADEDFSRAQ